MIRALLAVTALQGGAQAQDPVAEQPTYQVGDRWQYSFVNRRFGKPGCEYDLSVERVADSGVQARVQYPAGCEVSLVTAYPVAPGSVHRFDPGLNPYYHSPQPYRWLDFPLRVGKRWEQTWTFSLNGWRYENQVEAVVEDRERVTVAAGEFDTYRVRLMVSYTGWKSGATTQAGRYVDTLWYSPQVRNFVRRTFLDPGWAQIERELVSYRIVPAPAFAQSPGAVAPPLVGTWLLTVQGIADNETRTLIIASEPGPGPSASISARYGLTSRNKTPVEARVVQDRSPRQLVIVTQAQTVATLDETPDGAFAGTFVTRNGKSHGARLVRVDDADTIATARPQTAPAVAAAPQPVPAACAAFEGRWMGRFTLGNTNPMWLWVKDVKPDCTLHLAYLSEDREPRGWSAGRIADDSLTFLCNRNTNGTCVFRRRGEDLWVSYSGNLGQNSGVFSRVPRPKAE